MFYFSLTGGLVKLMYKCKTNCIKELTLSKIKPIHIHLLIMKNIFLFLEMGQKATIRLLEMCCLMYLSALLDVFGKEKKSLYC